MAFSSGLSSCFLDIKNYSERVLELQIAPIDLQWISKLVFNKQPDVVKFAYCLHTLKCENEGRQVTAPGYSVGILDLEKTILRLLQFREDYWATKAPILHFLHNVDFEFLRPSPRVATREQGTSTSDVFAVPQDVRQRPEEYYTKAQGKRPEETSQAQRPHSQSTSVRAAISTNPKLRKRPSTIRREDQAMYVIPAKRMRTSSPTRSESESAEDWGA